MTGFSRERRNFLKYVITSVALAPLLIITGEEGSILPDANALQSDPSLISNSGNYQSSSALSLGSEQASGEYYYGISVHSPYVTNAPTMDGVETDDEWKNAFVDKMNLQSGNKQTLDSFIYTEHTDVSSYWHYDLPTTERISENDIIVLDFDYGDHGGPFPDITCLIADVNSPNMRVTSVFDPNNPYLSKIVAKVGLGPSSHSQNKHWQAEIQIPMEMFTTYATHKSPLVVGANSFVIISDPQNPYNVNYPRQMSNRGGYDCDLIFDPQTTTSTTTQVPEFPDLAKYFVEGAAIGGATIVMDKFSKTRTQQREQ